MHLYQVGKLYHPGRRQWPERIVYEFRGGGHELLLFLASPSSREIEAVRSGETEFGIILDPPVIVVLSRFSLQGKPVSTSDSPYSWWLSAEEERALPNPEPTEAERIVLSVTLIDAATGIIKVLRALTLSPEFSRLLHQAIRDQAATPYPGNAVYAAALDRLYRRYGSPESMLAKSLVRCKGGS